MLATSLKTSYYKSLNAGYAGHPKAHAWPMEEILHHLDCGLGLRHPSLKPLRPGVYSALRNLRPEFLKFTVLYNDPRWCMVSAIIGMIRPSTRSPTMMRDGTALRPTTLQACAPLLEQFRAMNNWTCWFLVGNKGISIFLILSLYTMFLYFIIPY